MGLPLVGRTPAELTRLAGFLSMAAGVVHGLVSPSHFQEWWGYGVFFMSAALAQFLYGFGLLMTGPPTLQLIALGDVRAHKLARQVVAAGILGNLAIIALYLVTRTVGIPFFGPEAGEVEAVSPLDVASKATEGLLVYVLLVLRSDLTLRREGHPFSPAFHAGGTRPGEAQQGSERPR